MKKPKLVKTTFSTYVLEKSIGQGGNGYVYKAKDEDENYFAIKILDPSRITDEKIKRFKNEYIFCSNNKHPNIITVIDHGLTEDNIPFFVMPIFKGSLRDLIGNVSEDQAFNIALKILDGVEASHKLNVIHRDLKPENILHDFENGQIVITDFGIARFSEEELFTAVETKDATRLANFQYAAPEQRNRNDKITTVTDIYALGLIINELFTNKLALGKNHRTIGDVSEKYNYLDNIIDRMLNQEPSERFSSIDEIKKEMIVRGKEYISLQQIDKLNNIVTPSSEISDPIINDPMKITNVDWDKGTLTIELNHKPNRDWLWAFGNMGNYTFLYGKDPVNFSFHGNKAVIDSLPDEAQEIVNHFKQWLEKISKIYEQKLIRNAKAKENAEIKAIENQIKEEETRNRVLSSIKF